MHWDRLFEDLEGQLASEWEAERAALDAEAERLRISRIDMRTRLSGIMRSNAEAVVGVRCDERLCGRIHTVGADWIALRRGRDLSLIPLAAITGLHVDHGILLDSLDADAEPSLQERMTLGFVVRDLARRRHAVHLRLDDAVLLHGTIDRAGIDHLDLAVHDAGEPRRASAVRSFQIVPFAALIRIELGTTDI